MWNIGQYIENWVKNNPNSNWVPCKRYYCWYYKNSGFAIDVGDQFANIYFSQKIIDNNLDFSIPSDYRYFCNPKDDDPELVMFLESPTEFVKYVHNREIEATLRNLN